MTGKNVETDHLTSLRAYRRFLAVISSEDFRFRWRFLTKVVGDNDP